jgi:fumarate hydratase subunit beta
MLINPVEINLNGFDPASLKAGMLLTASGVIYTARDAAHKRFVAEGAPFSLKDAVIFYSGPSETPPGAVIGSIGATTSSRMDSYTAFMLEQGVRTFIGKGVRGAEANRLTKEAGAVYLIGIGGAAAKTRRCVSSCEIIAYPELLSEAVRRLTVRELPLIVASDVYGNSVFSYGEHKT